jgi:hypothetical protein
MTLKASVSVEVLKALQKGWRESSRRGNRDRKANCDFETALDDVAGVLPRAKDGVPNAADQADRRLEQSAESGTDSIRRARCSPTFLFRRRGREKENKK